ncbi:DUF2332 domain-containing protein [Rhizobium grahamii]|uniref:DUF2332 domain-containing protein n=1 Tax=Rhizobium grahamii TaxID=1120045 RepID=A0A370KMW2_9HYPH|nr:DUF2332 domain-containing protein [Rhizobium grahamii]RDJ09873.1 hypothetical protein B5K06_16930 [Rhizobium grahamii]
MEDIAERYRRFARLEAAGRSALYEQLALHVAKSPDILTFLSRMPPEKQQPNLLFAAVRLVTGTPSSAVDFEDAVRNHSDAVTAVMMTRTTQTNEPGRCAGLLPSLARLQGPLALIEVGTSAGLCLLPDYYGYDWGRRHLQPPAPFQSIAPIFDCRVSEEVPLPQQHPEIVWRVGLDLKPLDVSKDDDVRWLENLVWPEHHDRLSRLRKAMRLARENKPRIVAGDLRTDLGSLLDEAPRDATVVVFHTAVLGYVSSQDDRDNFARSLIGTRAVWLSNESPTVFPELAAKAGALREDMFLLSVNGEPQAWCAPHGQELSWI